MVFCAETIFERTGAELPTTDVGCVVDMKSGPRLELGAEEMVVGAVGVGAGAGAIDGVDVLVLVVVFTPGTLIGESVGGCAAAAPAVAALASNEESIGYLKAL